MAFYSGITPSFGVNVILLRRMTRFKEDGGRAQVSVSPNALWTGLTREQTINLIPSEAERETPNRACRLFTGDAL